MSRRAVFLDRDGVVVATIMRGGQPAPPFSREELFIFPYAQEAIQMLRSSGFLVILASNQPDVAYGNISFSEWHWLQYQVEEELGFDDVFICSHTRHQECSCKKPQPGLLVVAAHKWDLDLASCYFIGDTAADTLAAQAVGCRSILISAAYNIEVPSDFRVSDILAAARLIETLEKGGGCENIH